MLLRITITPCPNKLHRTNVDQNGPYFTHPDSQRYLMLSVILIRCGKKVMVKTKGKLHICNDYVTDLRIKYVEICEAVWTESSTQSTTSHTKGMKKSVLWPWPGSAIRSKWKVCCTYTMILLPSSMWNIWDMHPIFLGIRLVGDNTSKHNETLAQSPIPILIFHVLFVFYKYDNIK